MMVDQQLQRVLRLMNPHRNHRLMLVLLESLIRGKLSRWVVMSVMPPRILLNVSLSPLLDSSQDVPSSLVVPHSDSQRLDVYQIQMQKTMIHFSRESQHLVFDQ